MTHPPPPTAPASRRSLWAALHLATWRGRFAWFFALVLLAFFTCWVLVRMTPAWYRPLDPDDPGVVTTASRAQTLIIDLGSSHDRPVTWTITQDEINSLMAVIAAPPFDAQGNRAAIDPAHNPVSDPYVILLPGQVTICARVTKIPSRSPQGGVGSLIFSVGTTTGPDGRPMGLVKLTDVWAGDLPAPRSVVETSLRALVPTIYEVTRQAVQTRAGIRNVTALEPFLEAFAHSLGEGTPFPLHFTKDGREWSLQDMRVEKGSFTVTIVPGRVVGPTTVPPASRSPTTLPR